MKRIVVTLLILAGIAWAGANGIIDGGTGTVLFVAATAAAVGVLRFLAGVWIAFQIAIS